MRKWSYGLLHIICFSLAIALPGLLLSSCDALPSGVVVALDDYHAAKSALSLAVVGDVLLSPNCAWRSAEEVAGDCCDYGALMRPARPYLKEADFAFCNLEAPLSLRGYSAGRQWNFRAAPRSVEALVKTGFSVVSLANNHILDYGDDALSDTLYHLKKAGIQHSGISSDGDLHRPVFLEANGIRLALLSYSNVYPGDYYRARLKPVRGTCERLQRDIEEARQEADHVAVSIHWGEEYATSVSAEQRKLGRFMIDCGATVVLGHHPHVLQEVEEYGDGIIFYSLGNFLFKQGSLRTRETRIYTLFLNKEGVKRVSYMPIEFKVHPWRMESQPFSRREWTLSPGR